MTIGEKIKELRSENNWTQKDLAEKLFITPQALSRWENGTAEPPISSINKLAQIFGASTDELFGIEHHEEEKPEQVLSVKALLPIATCCKCGRNLYETDKIENITFSYKERHGRAFHTEHVTKKCCHECYERHMAETKAAALQKLEFDKKRGRKFRIGHYFGAAAFGILLALFIYFEREPIGIPDPKTYIPVTIVAAILGYALMGCFILGNTFVTEHAFKWVKFGFKLPFGIIFGDLFDMIIFKIVMLILGFLWGILTFIFSVIVWGTIGMFTYPYALVKAYKNPEKCWEE